MISKYYSLASVALISLLSACIAGDVYDDGIGAITAEAIDPDSREIAPEHTKVISVTSGPEVYRNTDSYDLSVSGGPLAVLVVSTNPAQPFAPVYSWRTHTQHTGPGPYGYAGDLIGYTDSQGIFQITGRLPNDASLCGEFTNERFAVGSPYATRSASIEFQIYRGLDFSPAHPDCLPYW